MAESFRLEEDRLTVSQVLTEEIPSERLPDEALHLLPGDLNSMNPLVPTGEKKKRAIWDYSDGILQEFRSKNNNKRPRKGNLRMLVIRMHKKANRCISKNEKPKSELKLEDSTQLTKLWEKLSDIYLEGNLGYLSATEQGPLSDGKTKGNHRKNKLKSFNKEFMQYYFAKKSMRQSYFYFIELLFNPIQPKKLCQQLNIRCCPNDEHRCCYQKWEALKYYLQFQTLEQLEIQPWSPY